MQIKLVPATFLKPFSEDLADRMGVCVLEFPVSFCVGQLQRKHRMSFPPLRAESKQRRML